MIATVVGLFVTFYQSQDDVDSVAAWANGFFIIIWAALFLRFWERRQNSLQVKWDTADFEAEEVDRFEFEGTWKVSPITTEMEQVFTDSERYRRFAVTGCCMCLCLMVVLTNSIIVILVKQKLKDAMGQKGGSFGGVYNAITVYILNSIYKGIAYSMNNYENHQTKTQ
jgi:hypothetical protein